MSVNINITKHEKIFIDPNTGKEIPHAEFYRRYKKTPNVGDGGQKGQSEKA